MVRRRWMIAGSFVTLSVAVPLVAVLAGPSVWTEPPEFFRTVAPTQDTSRVIEFPTTGSVGPTPWMSVRRRTYEFEMPSALAIAKLDAQLKEPEWSYIKAISSTDVRREGKMYRRRGIAAPKALQVLVWKRPVTLTTKVEIVESREASPLEQAVAIMRRPFARP